MLALLRKAHSSVSLAWAVIICTCCRRMLDTFVEVVRRGMQEGVDEVTVTYNAPVAPRPGAEPQDDRGDSEDLPDLLPINDGVHPSIYLCKICSSPATLRPHQGMVLQVKLYCSGPKSQALSAAVWGPPDSDEEADEEDLIQEFGQPMDTSSDSPARRSMSEQAALEVGMPTDLKHSLQPGLLCPPWCMQTVPPCSQVGRMPGKCCFPWSCCSTYRNITGLRSQVSQLLTLSTSNRGC